MSSQFMIPSNSSGSSSSSSATFRVMTDAIDGYKWPDAHTFDISSLIPNYTKLTADNFAAAYMPFGSSGYSLYMTGLGSLSYDSSTGIVTYTPVCNTTGYNSATLYLTLYCNLSKKKVYLGDYQPGAYEMHQTDKLIWDCTSIPGYSKLQSKDFCAGMTTHETKNYTYAYYGINLRYDAENGKLYGTSYGNASYFPGAIKFSAWAFV
mgnify:CR=1 FL=1